MEAAYDAAGAASRQDGPGFEAAQRTSITAGSGKTGCLTVRPSADSSASLMPT